MQENDSCIILQVFETFRLEFRRNNSEFANLDCSRINDYFESPGSLLFITFLFSVMLATTKIFTYLGSMK